MTKYKNKNISKLVAALSDSVESFHDRFSIPKNSTRGMWSDGILVKS